MAYEIHDGLAQQLTGALYKFQSIEPLGERDPQAARKMFDEAVQLLREAMAETRRLIGGLRPPILDESGVVAAIEYLISEQRQQGGPEIEFVHPADVDRLAAPLEGAVFRIVQECLTNACRYSQSAKVRVELRQAEGRVSHRGPGLGNRLRSGAGRGRPYRPAGDSPAGPVVGRRRRHRDRAGQGDSHPRGTPVSSASGKLRTNRLDG